MEIVKQEHKALTLLAEASQEVRDMVQDLKTKIMDVKVFYESVKVKMHKEGFSDPEIWIVTDYVLSELPMTVKERRNFIKDLKPIKEIKGLEKITSSSPAMEEITLLRCNFIDVDKNKKRGKQRLIDIISESEDWVDFQVLGTIVGAVSDQR